MPPPLVHTVYRLEWHDETFYIGLTTDPLQRWLAHVRRWGPPRKATYLYASTCAEAAHRLEIRMIRAARVDHPSRCLNRSAAYAPHNHACTRSRCSHDQRATAVTRSEHPPARRVLTSVIQRATTQRTSRRPRTTVRTRPASTTPRLVVYHKASGRDLFNIDITRPLKFLERHLGRIFRP